MQEIIKKIRAKKELSDISNEVIEEILKTYLKKYNINLPSARKEQKILIKEIRAELRKYVGRFQIKSGYKNRLNLLEQNNIKRLLETHASTKERVPHYPKLIRLINKLKPKSILDLGCGLNPIVLSSKLSKIKYYAYDIKEDEIKLINLYFKKHKIKGKAEVKDIRKMKAFPQVDMCLILKTLDIIDTKKHLISKSIMKNVKCNYIIASFSTRTLSGKPMAHAKRQWFENILKDLDYKYKITKTKNEVFYLIRKLSPQKKLKTQL